MDYAKRSFDDYTMDILTHVNNSPSSDRLVICTDSQSPRDAIIPHSRQPLHNNANVTEDNRFSVANLLSGKYVESTSHHVPEPENNQLLPSIHEAFPLYSGTTLADTIASIYDLVQPNPLPIPPNHVKMVQQVAICSRERVSPLDLHPQDFTSNKKKKIITQTGGGKGTFQKPPYTYIGMIIVAIDSSEDKMLTLHCVREKLMAWLPLFNGTYTGWRESIRHTLSSHECFYKVKLAPGNRGYLWAINYRNVKPTHLTRQNKSHTDLYQYKFHLNEQVGTPSVRHSTHYNDLNLPFKPSLGSRETSIVGCVSTDFPWPRTDDVMSECNESPTVTSMKVPITVPISHKGDQQKRKASETSEVQQDEIPKRRKTAAVNPTPKTNSISSHLTIPEVTNTSQNSTPYERLKPSYNITDTTSNLSDLMSNQANHSTLHHGYYQPDLYPSGHYSSPYSAIHSSAMSPYQPYQLPYSTDPTTCSMYPSSNFLYSGLPSYGYQHCDVQQSYSVSSAYPTRPYPMNFGIQEHDSNSGYCQRQSTDPSGGPVNLCKSPQIFRVRIH